METKKWEPMEFNDARKASIKTAFDAESGDGKLAAKAVHKLVFSQEERAEYGFDTFEEVRHLLEMASLGAAAGGVGRGASRIVCLVYHPLLVSRRSHAGRAGSDRDPA